MKLITIVAAAGRGRRFSGGGGEEKLFAKVSDRPLLCHTLKAIEKARCVSGIVVVAGRSGMKQTRRMVREYGLRKVISVVEGGRTRFDSVKRGLTALPENADYVAIHDGARPLVTEDVINRVFGAARRHGAAIAAVPERNTVKESDGRGMIRSTPGRDRLWEAQTPQVFRREIIVRAYGKCAYKSGITDDAAAVERLGIGVRLVKGDYSNIKVTTRRDLAVAAALLKAPL